MCKQALWLVPAPPASTPNQSNRDYRLDEMVYLIIEHFTYPDLPFVKRSCYAWATHLESTKAKRLKILNSGLCLGASRSCVSVCMLLSNWSLRSSEWAGNVRYPTVFTGCGCSKSDIISGLLVCDPMGPVLSRYICVELHLTEVVCFSKMVEQTNSGHLDIFLSFDQLVA